MRENQQVQDEAPEYSAPAPPDDAKLFRGTGPGTNRIRCEMFISPLLQVSNRGSSARDTADRGSCFLLRIACRVRTVRLAAAKRWHLLLLLESRGLRTRNGSQEDLGIGQLLHPTSQRQKGWSLDVSQPHHTLAPRFQGVPTHGRTGGDSNDRNRVAGT